MGNIELKTWNDFTFLGNMKSNPSGSAYAYVRSTVDLAKDGYSHNIFVKTQEKDFQLTGFNKESSYIWLDDETILFTSSRDKEESALPSTDFFEISVHGGEGIKRFSLPLFVTRIDILEGGKFLISAISDVSHPNAHAYDDGKRGEVAKSIKEMSFVEELHEIPFVSNGSGSSDSKRNRLYLFEESSKKLTPLTSAHFQVMSIEVSEDKQQIFYTGVMFKDVAKLYNHVYKLDVNSLRSTKLTKGNKMRYGAIKLLEGKLVVMANDGKRIGLNQNSDVYLLDVNSGNLELWFKNDRSFYNSVGSDVRLLGSSTMQVYGDTLYCVITTCYHNQLLALRLHQEPEVVLSAGSIDGMAQLDGKLHLIALEDQKLQEIYEVNERKLIQLTKLNEEVLKDKYVAKPVQITYVSYGEKMLGWVLLPENFDSSNTYPAILDIHGGPKTVYGEVYYHEMQLWANLGYVVMFTNPHGSDGRGDEFSDIRGKYGTIDYDDLMSFVDKVCLLYPNIDTTRLGVTGGSYGGFMTNWIVGHTTRFKAAATQRSISNWLSFHGVSDIGYYFAPDQNAGDLYDDMKVEKYWTHSPLKYVKNVKTPTLVIHSKEDYRCPIDQGYQWFTSLKELGVDSKMVVFNSENHDLSRSGKPKARNKRLEELTQWFEHYLKTKE